MQCKMVFNFTVRHVHGFRSCQTRWPLIGLRNLILIGQLRIWWKLSHPHLCKLFKYRLLSHSNEKMQTKVANSVCYEICWFYSKFLLFDVNYMFRSLRICYYDVNFTYCNHSINQDSAHWPTGIKMHRPISSYLVRELNRDVMRN